MFEALWDEVTKLGSWRWPVAQGEVTDCEIELVYSATRTRRKEYPRLSVAYKFSLGNDGPYTGESFWTPTWTFGEREKLEAAENKLRPGHPLEVHYRPDDPSVNTVDLKKHLQDL